jgi:hypothetical protein
MHPEGEATAAGTPLAKRLGRVGLWERAGFGRGDLDPDPGDLPLAACRALAPVLPER